MRGPDPIPIGRANLKQLIVYVFISILTITTAVLQREHHFRQIIKIILFYKHFDMSDLNSGLPCPESINPTTFLKSQPLSQPCSRPFNQQPNRPSNQRLNQPLS